MIKHNGFDNINISWKLAVLEHCMGWATVMLIFWKVCDDNNLISPIIHSHVRQIVYM